MATKLEEHVQVRAGGIGARRYVLVPIGDVRIGDRKVADWLSGRYSELKEFSLGAGSTVMCHGITDAGDTLSLSLRAWQQLPDYEPQFEVIHRFDTKAEADAFAARDGGEVKEL